MPKQTLRQLMLAQRKALLPHERIQACRAIERAFLSTKQYAQSAIIALYAAIRGEVEMDGILNASLSAGKEVLFPVVSGDTLVFRRIRHREELHPGTFGIFEPDESCPVLSPADADLLVVPAVAFDLDGQRIGYGRGFYDRTLHQLEGRGKLIGLCYDFQLVDRIAGEPHDVKMDMIITDKRVIHPTVFTIEKEVLQQ